MPQMRNYTCGNKQLPFSIVVDAPRIAEAMRHNLENFLSRVISPYTAVDWLAFTLELDRLGIWLTVFENLAFTLRLANHRRGEHTLAAVDPSIGPPVQTIEYFVPVAYTPTC
ncbi:MAG TPA: hypothetical protein DCP58_03250 [Verrucomicrobiales bacterium]|nr:hypothetical protein [Verrucomicrobiales bacterium]